MHIGLIGGIGPASTTFYYERIVRAFNQAGTPLHLTIGHTDVQRLVQNVEAGRPDQQAEEYRRITAQLAAAGAEAVAITSMGGHFCAPAFEAISPLPVLNGPNAVGTEVGRLGLKRVGIIGTNVVMRTGLYGALSGIEVLTPLGADFEQTHADYVAVGTTGQATPDQHQRLVEAARGLCEDRGADAVILGGTDLFVVFRHESPRYRVIDSAEVHIDAIVKAAIQEQSA